MPTAQTSASTPDEIVQHIEQLPAPPAVATRIIDAATDPDSDFSLIARLIESDTGLSIKVLHMANSMAYGYRGKIENLEQAVATLGLDTLINALLSVVIRDTLFENPSQGDPSLIHLWKHSLASAVAAELLAKQLLPQRSAAAFAAGLIHDCGQMVLLSVLGDSYEAVLDACLHGQGPLLDLEEARLDVTHTEVGRILLSRWNMPESLTDAAWMHHHDPATLTEVKRDKTLTTIISLADVLAHEVMNDAPWPGGDEFRRSLLHTLGLHPKDLDAIKADMGQAYAQRADLFDLESDATLFYFEALQRANARLATINTEIARREEHLLRANRVLEAVTETGPILAQAPDSETVFRAVAKAFGQTLGSPKGFVYLVDTVSSQIKGLSWGIEGNVRLFHHPLDDSLVPIQGKGAGTEPLVLCEVLAGYLTRIPTEFDDDPTSRLLNMPPWLVLPLITEDGFVGEIGFAPGDSNSMRLPLEQRQGFAQLAEFTAAALGRMALHSRLEERAERLASALRKIRRMDHKLLQAERLASVGQLAAGAAHEINNPLAIIYARAQLLELGETDEKKKQDFQQMMTQMERITGILTNLMDFARPAPPQMAPLTLSSVAKRTLALVRSGIEQQGIVLRAELADDLPEIVGDGNQLEQVLLNLVINAEHAVEDRPDPDAPGLITVSTSSRGNHLALCVSDNGVGIQTDDLNKIFDPFFTTKEEGRGTGLGLSTAYGIIQSHGGDIRYQSTPGKGTEVTVLLPLSQDILQSSQDIFAPAPATDTILVVDDEKHIRDILKESLEAQGYSVETAENGEQGLAKLRKGSYRLLLLDIRMPSRDGLSLLAEAKGLIGSMPVIVLTGLASPEELSKALELGALKCIRKPFQVDALLAEVAKATRTKANS